jgi:hypothetical protein
MCVCVCVCVFVGVCGCVGVLCFQKTKNPGQNREAVVFLRGAENQIHI